LGVNLNSCNMQEILNTWKPHLPLFKTSPKPGCFIADNLYDKTGRFNLDTLQFRRCDTLNCHNVGTMPKCLCNGIPQSSEYVRKREVVIKLSQWVTIDYTVSGHSSLIHNKVTNRSLYRTTNCRKEQ
jgi:hypothetical protein